MMDGVMGMTHGWGLVGIVLLGAIFVGVTVLLARGRNGKDAR